MNQLNWKEFSLQNKATLGTSQLATRLANMAYLLEKIAQIEHKYFSASILAEQVRRLFSQLATRSSTTSQSRP